MNTEGIMKRILAEQFAQLGADDLLRLSQGLENLCKQAEGRWQWGSACSGSDVVFLALEALHDFWKSRMSSTPKIAHTFSCEDVGFKQECISVFFAPQHIFPNIHLLKADSVQDIHGNDVSDLSCDAFVAGVECDSISGLNREHADNYDCATEFSDAPTKTGDTLRSALGFLERRRPPPAILENVKNMACIGKSGQSNLDWLVRCANRLGYHVVNMVLSASSYGVPQQRDRMYIICVFVGGAPDQSTSGPDDESKPEPGWAHDLRAFIKSMNIDSFELHEFLSADSDPEVVAANAALAPPMKKLKRKRGEDPEADGKQAAVHKYQVEHLERYSQAHVAWPPELQMYPAFVAKASCLPPRAQEILFLEETLSGPAENLLNLKCRDLNMTMAWGSWRESHTPCVVSTASMWLRGPRPGGAIDRLLSGKELLHLQGFEARVQEAAPQAFSHKDKTDLAGNAFCGPILLALVSGVVACVDWDIAFRSKDHVACRAVPAPALVGLAPQESLDGDSLCGEEDGGESEEPEVDSEVEPCSDLSFGSFSSA